MSSNKLFLDDDKFVSQFLSQLSQSEVNLFLNFLISHNPLSIEVELNLLRNELPELYDKLIIIGGNLNGCK